MAASTPLLTLAHYLAGEFDNRAQAIAEPAWFVHLRLWHRPLSLFPGYVSLGFEVSSTEFLSSDKGIELATGKALWGAIIGPYRYTKRESYE